MDNGQPVSTNTRTQHSHRCRIPENGAPRAAHRTKHQPLAAVFLAAALSLLPASGLAQSSSQPLSAPPLLEDNLSHDFTAANPYGEPVLIITHADIKAATDYLRQHTQNTVTRDQALQDIVTRRTAGKTLPDELLSLVLQQLDYSHFIAFRIPQKPPYDAPSFRAQHGVCTISGDTRIRADASPISVIAATDLDHHIVEWRGAKTKVQDLSFTMVREDYLSIFRTHEAFHCIDTWYIPHQHSIRPAPPRSIQDYLNRSEEFLNTDYITYQSEVFADIGAALKATAEGRPDAAATLASMRAITTIIVLNANARPDYALNTYAQLSNGQFPKDGWPDTMAYVGADAFIHNTTSALLAVQDDIDAGRIDPKGKSIPELAAMAHSLTEQYAIPRQSFRHLNYTAWDAARQYLGTYTNDTMNQSMRLTPAHNAAIDADKTEFDRALSKAHDYATAPRRAPPTTLTPAP